ncbi:MAG: hypothetical protein U5O39_17560 [Gammaproteobacteria bacterium]|nr:hypothetical protein [Gammaproteobacteria bacterium]
MTRDPGMPEKLMLAFGGSRLGARRLEIAPEEDEWEACFDRDWSDGLPVVPPTELRVIRMLAGTTRDAGEVVGEVPPDYAPCTIEKIAINAVLAGCKPEYMPVVIAAVEAALQDEFCMHGLLATTYFSGPMVIVNGPIAQKIGMNARGNALGQGNRANATIGRALQLVIRNVGGGKPGGVDRAALGNPGKYTFCFAEDEAGSCWESLAAELGFSPEASTVTLFAADGVQGISSTRSHVRRSRCVVLSRLACGLPRIRRWSWPLMPFSSFLRNTNACFVRPVGRRRRSRKRSPNSCRFRARNSCVALAVSRKEYRNMLRDKTLPKFRDGGLNIVRPAAVPLFLLQ